jgi:hypothetical protein
MGDVNSGTQTARPRRTVRKVLLVVLGIAVLGAIGTAGAAFVAYDKATELDRSYPEVVVRDYVDALFIRQDDVRAHLYTCKDSGELTEIVRFRDELAKGESEGQPSQVIIGPRILDEARATVRTELQIRMTSNGVTQKELQVWVFSMVEQDGWRVCGAVRAPSGNLPSTQPTLQ